MFMRNPFHLPRLWDRIVNTIAYAIGISWILFQPYVDGKAFSLNDSDIIILILANVSVAGSIIYICTMKKYHRAPFHHSVHPRSVPLCQRRRFVATLREHLHTYSVDVSIPVSGIPAHHHSRHRSGDLLKQWLAITPEETVNDESTKKRLAPYIMLLSLAVVVTNVVCLYNRVMVLNLVLTALEVSAPLYLLRSDDTEMKLWKKFCRYGTYFLCSVSASRRSRAASAKTMSHSVIFS